uniref:phage tail tip lysozyme n=1 Tax=Staphylococcus capitis TaxID=29388 RepID=UPI00066AF918
GGKGLVQWDGARRNQLYNFAKGKGKAWTDIGVQLEFLWKELNSTEAAALTYLRRTTSAVQAAQVFQQKFERAGIPNQGARNSAASKYYNQFKGKS